VKPDGFWEVVMSDAHIIQSFKEFLQRQSERPDTNLCPHCGALMTLRMFRFYFSDDAVDVHVPICPSFQCSATKTTEAKPIPLRVH
jgi:hypothetical protein